jgi:D-alanyl-D-alanine carboxypeptidase
MVTLSTPPMLFRKLAAVALAAVLGLAALQPAAAASRQAAIVVDANTGKTLYSSNADAPRYPASLTKMMTLYMVFEALSAGKIKKTTPITFSAHASAMPPTKLGVKAGRSVPVETIIYSLVTKSANDAAAAIAEHLGGSEQGFARIMTAKARKLGMRDTVFRNASGLPNSEQRTTARDMAVLGIALREHFPQYYSYFSTRSFTYGRQRMGNHNKLLGRVKGVDGIKTGYTRASGFNLVSSVNTGGRKVVAVVMGGQSGRSRDNQMAALLRKYVSKASTRGGGDLVARSAPAQLNMAANEPASERFALPKVDAPTPDFRPHSKKALAAVAAAAAADDEIAAVEQAYAGGSAEIDPVQTASVPDGWAVQVAAAQSEADARKKLAATQQAAPVLADASGFTVAFNKDGVTYYRVRFGGFSSKTAAWNACNALKKKKIACYAVQQ